MPAGHCRLDDGLLHRASVRARRLGAETVEAEPGELSSLPGIVPLPAPIAGAGIVAGGVPQPADQPSRPPGNWWRTQGGMTELPPATESQARA